MAMPQDFWRNAQSLSLFRSKPCQRLANDGMCGWKSQCQYSHCAEAPRRQPLKHMYSPMICPHVRMALSGDLGDVSSLSPASACPDGMNCQMAHTKEEILFHPEIFKTILCDEYDENRRNSRRRRCHRYYCPLAHGNQELRPSSLSLDYRQACLRTAEFFPSDSCCQLCAPSFHIKAPSKLNSAAPVYCPGERIGQLNLENHIQWNPPSAISQMLSPPPGPPSDTTDQVPYLSWIKDYLETETTDDNDVLDSGHRSTLGPNSPLRAPPGLEDTSPAFIDVTGPPGLVDASPAFIDIARDGKMTVGCRSSAGPAMDLDRDVKALSIFTLL